MNTTINFTPNATITTALIGSTPYIVGCDQTRVRIPVGTRVQILETNYSWTREYHKGFGWIGYWDHSKPRYTIRMAGEKPNTYWRLHIGEMDYPLVKGEVKLDEKP